jgi:SOS response regulatory protein OraA/RecX
MKAILFTEEEIEKLIKWFMKENWIDYRDFSDNEQCAKILSDFYYWLNKDAS